MRHRRKEVPPQLLASIMAFIVAEGGEVSLDSIRMRVFEGAHDGFGLLIGCSLVGAVERLQEQGRLIFRDGWDLRGGSASVRARAPPA